MALLLLTIPYVGYQFVREMENYLRDGLEQSVLGAAQALAGALHDRPDLNLESPPRNTQIAYDGEIYAHPLPRDMQIDGYVEDWGGHLEQLESLGSDAHEPRARFVAGKHGSYLYLLVMVRDERIVYRGLPVRVRPTSDYVKLVTVTAGGQRRTYLFNTISPGWITVYVLADDQAAAGLRQESRIRAEWRETEDGYLVEARIPLALLGPRVGIEVGDVDTLDRAVEPFRLSTSGAGPLTEPGPLMLPSEGIEALIKSLGRTPGRRIWVVDSEQRVLARGGSLDRQTEPVPVNPLFALVLRPPPAEMFEEQPIMARFSGPEVRPPSPDAPPAVGAPPGIRTPTWSRQPTRCGATRAWSARWWWRRRLWEYRWCAARHWPICSTRRSSCVSSAPWCCWCSPPASACACAGCAMRPPRPSTPTAGWSVP